MANRSEDRRALEAPRTDRDEGLAFIIYGITGFLVLLLVIAVVFGIVVTGQ